MLAAIRMHELPGAQEYEDAPAGVAEAGRVLAEGGRLCVCVTHPIADAGSWSDDDATFNITDNCLQRRRFEGTFERTGLSMTFRGWCYPMQDYAEAFEGAGVVIERIREPAPPKQFAVTPRAHRWQRIPMFLFLRGFKGTLTLKKPNLQRHPLQRTSRHSRYCEILVVSVLAGVTRAATDLC